jgi:hypothetical protein
MNHEPNVKLSNDWHDPKWFKAYAGKKPDGNDSYHIEYDILDELVIFKTMIEYLIAQYYVKKDVNSKIYVPYDHKVFVLDHVGRSVNAWIKSHDASHVTEAVVQVGMFKRLDLSAFVNIPTLTVYRTMDDECRLDLFSCMALARERQAFINTWNKAEIGTDVEIPDELIPWLPGYCKGKLKKGSEIGKVCAKNNQIIWKDDKGDFVQIDKGTRKQKQVKRGPKSAPLQSAVVPEEEDDADTVVEEDDSVTEDI